MKFRLPPNTSCVGVDGHEFFADENGIIDATGHSGSTMEKLMLMKAEPLAPVPANLAEIKATAAVSGAIWPGVIRFKAPHNVSCVSVGAAEFQVDEDGIVAVENCPHETARLLEEHCKCTLVAPIEVQMRQQETAQKRDVREGLKTFLRDILKKASISFDGRATVEHLQDLAKANNLPTEMPA
jgi:hypothetical protein